MNCLKNSRSVLSHLLRQKPAVCTPPPPAQAPGSRCFHTFRILRDRPAHRSPQSTHRRYQHTSRRGGSRWYEDERVQVSAVLVAGGGAVAVFCCSKEVVPYTNRTRFIILSPNAELRLGEFMFEVAKRELGSKILPPHDPDSVRVRRIAEEIVRGVHRGLALDASDGSKDATCGYGDISADRTIKNRDDAEDGSPRENAAQRDENRGKPRGAQANLEGLNWEVIVVRDKRINAMCAPGGKIIVYTGLLDKFREDAEIATVLGHEVVILQFIDMPDTVGAMSKLSLRLPFSRRMEMEADHVGLMLLAAAGYDPRVTRN